MNKAVFSVQTLDEITGESREWVETEASSEAEARRLVEDLGRSVGEIRMVRVIAATSASSTHQARGSSQKVQQIEQTSKTWKALILLGSVGLTLGLVLCLTGVNADHDVMTTQVGLGFVLSVVSLATLIVGRLGAWWFHG